MCCTGGGAYQTLLKRVAAPGYPSRPDMAVHAITMKVPLEGSLQTGGITFVLKTGQQQWLACRAEGVLRSDFFVSTHQVCIRQQCDAMLRRGSPPELQFCFSLCMRLIQLECTDLGCANEIVF